MDHEKSTTVEEFVKFIRNGLIDLHKRNANLGCETLVSLITLVLINSQSLVTTFAVKSEGNTYIPWLRERARAIEVNVIPLTQVDRDLVFFEFIGEKGDGVVGWESKEKVNAFSYRDGKSFEVRNGVALDSASRL